MKLVLEMLTPVHIGSGDVIEPYEYVITDRLHKINLVKFISSLDPTEREEFLELSSTDMMRTRKFIKEKARLSEVSEYSTRVSKDAGSIYNDKLNDPENILSIQTFIKTAEKPFIPGSSVKGAIRTAMLYSSLNKPAAYLEKDVDKQVFNFRNPQDDPFRVLKVSDSSPFGYKALILHNVKTYTTKKYVVPKQLTASGYNILLEATNSYFTDSPFRISHDLWIDENLKRNSNFMDISFESIVSSCNEFYSAVIKNELEFYESSDVSYAYDTYQQLESEFSKISKEKGSFLLRLGWGSGYDSTTVNLAKKNPDSKISRRLIYEEFPLGWVKAKLVEEEA